MGLPAIGLMKKSGRSGNVIFGIPTYGEEKVTGQNGTMCEIIPCDMDWLDLQRRGRIRVKCMNWIGMIRDCGGSTSSLTLIINLKGRLEMGQAGG